MLLVTAGSSSLRNLLNGKGAIATSQERGIYRARKRKGVNIASYCNNNNKMDF